MRTLDVDGLGPVSRIGLGTWQFGSREWGYGEGYAAGAARDIVRRARELGVTLFDTAEVYGFGRSDRRLQLPRIPLYQVHQPNPVVPDSVTMSGMRALLDEDRIGAVGVSNYSLDRWRGADAALGRPVVSNQVNFSLAHA